MLELAGALRDWGRISFVCPPSPMGQLCLDRAARLGLDVLALDWSQPRAAERFCKWIAERQSDICHIHAGIVWEGLGVVAAARKSGIPIVLRTEHLPYMSMDNRKRASYENAIQHVTKIICVSREARDSFVGAGIPSRLVTTIRNGVAAPSPRYGGNRIRASLGLDAKALIVLTVARYTEQKDHRRLLDAIPAVLTREPRARFVWVGTGPLEDTMRRTVHERRLGGHVILLGQRTDVPDLIAAADLFALPSRFEGLPLAVLEAMAGGLPVVGTCVCGIAEAVDDGVTGLLVEPGNTDALAAAISELLANGDRAALMGIRGRARVQQAFSLDRMVREIVTLYRGLLSPFSKLNSRETESYHGNHAAGANP